MSAAEQAARFSPGPNEEVALDVDGPARTFRALPHPAAPTFVHAMEGAKAHVYRIQDVLSGAEYALKVMKPRHREPSLVERCAALDALKDLPGMAVCERRCITTGNAPGALARHRDLAYSVLMPWMKGDTWYDVLQAGANGSALRERSAALDTAAHLAHVLASLESRGVAHCDLSAGNVMVETAASRVALLDVEDVFTPALPPPVAVPAGTPGYQHRTNHAGMWRPDGDRFAGAVLLAEMLAWWDPAVRAAAWAESYFDPAEVQEPGSARLGVLLDALRRTANGPAMAVLLEQAWGSRTLGECPPLSEWARAVSLARAGVSFSGRPIQAPASAPVAVFWSAIRPAETRAARVRWSHSSALPAPVPAPVFPDDTEA